MQVNSISSHGVSSPCPEQRAAALTSPPGPDQAEFTKSHSLDRLLEESPEVRAGEVGRAKVLASSVQYPPEELIDRISNLLARHWNESAE